MTYSKLMQHFYPSRLEERVSYVVWGARGKDNGPPAEHAGNVGDLCLNEAGQLWVRVHDGWKVVRATNGARGCQKHPSYPSVTLWVDKKAEEEVYWASPRQFQQGAAQKRSRDDDNEKGEEQRSRRDQSTVRRYHAVVDGSNTPSDGRTAPGTAPPGRNRVRIMDPKTGAAHRTNLGSVLLANQIQTLAFAHAEDHGNRFLMDICRDWMEVTRDNPTMAAHVGSEILAGAMKRSSPIFTLETIPVQDFLSSVATIQPSFDLVLQDLLTGPSALEAAVADTLVDKSWTKEMVLASMMYHGRLPTPNRHVSSAAVFDIPWTKSGLQAVPFKIPSVERTGSDVIYPYKRKDMEGTSALVLPGNVTMLHIDFLFVPVTVVPVVGSNTNIYKLWLLAPPTPFNLDLVQRLVFTGQPAIGWSGRVIQQLEQLHYVLQKGPTAPGFVIPPGWMHCVLTLAASCHTGFRFVVKKYEKQAKDFLFWVGDMLNDLPPGSKRWQLLKEIKESLTWWEVAVTTESTTEDWLAKARTVVHALERAEERELPSSHDPLSPTAHSN